MGADADRDLVRDLARPLVARFAPAEDGELFQVLSDAYFDDPRASAQTRQRAGPLAFGLPEVAMLLTPVLLAALSEVVDHLAGQAVARGLRATGRAIRRLFGVDGRAAPAPDEPVLVLSTEQWAEIHRIVERVGTLGGLPAGQARLIADAVVGQGQLGDPPPPADRRRVHGGRGGGAAAGHPLGAAGRGPPGPAGGRRRHAVIRVPRQRADRRRLGGHGAGHGRRRGPRRSPAGQPGAVRRHAHRAAVHIGWLTWAVVPAAADTWLSSVLG